MNTQEFLKVLEERHLVSADIIEKLHLKIDKTEKKVSAKSVAKYLIDKGYLSKYQANVLFEGSSKPEDDLEIAVPAEQAHDTSELLKDLQEFQQPPPRRPESTRTDLAPLEDIVIPGQDVEVVEVEHEMTMPGGVPAPELEAAAAYGEQPLADPLATEFDTLSYDQAAHVDEDTPGFVGKRTIQNQWESKWLFIGFGLLGMLVIVGIILWYTLFKTDAEKMWAMANTEFTEQRYQSAIEKFVDFVSAYPNEQRAPTAKVLIANCELRIPYDSRSWDTALERVKNVLPRLQTELEDYDAPERFEEIRDELSVILPGTALGFTRDAIEANEIEQKRQLLAKALEMKEQIDNSAYVPGSQLRKPGVSDVMTNFLNNVSIIERQIQMEMDYTEALDEVTQLTADGQTKTAFERYFALLAKYPELKIRQPLRQAMAAISDREADLVKTIDFQTTIADDVTTPIKSTVVVATKSGSASLPGLSDEMLVYLVKGALWGIRAADGQIIWRHFVGAETKMAPAWLDEPFRGDVIAEDQRLNQIMWISSADGGVKWQVSMGEPFNEPIIEGGMINVTTVTGKVLQIDPADGSSNRAAQIPQQASVSGVIHDKDPFIYQLGRNGNLYVISSESMTCREVFYVGHRPDSVTVPPLVLSGHIIVAENGPNYCRLHVIKPTENGLKLVQAQSPLRLDGQVNTPFVRYSRWGLVMSDSGDLRMLEVNLASEDKPVSDVVSAQFSRERQTRHYLLAAEGQLWTAGAGLRRYRIKKAEGNFDRQQIANNLDTFLAPLTKIGENLFEVRQRNSSALISIAAVDSTSLEEKWRTDFAAPLAGPPIEFGDSVMVVSSQGDVFDVDSPTLERGVTDQPVSRGSTVAQNLVFEQIVTLDPSRYVVTGPLDRSNILSLDGNLSPPNKLSNLMPPADQPSCRPIAFGNTLLVASRRGQVIRINPRNGQPIGAPFQPPLEPNVDVLWRMPAVIEDGERFVIANQAGVFYLVAADGEKALQRVDEYQYAGNVHSELVRVGDTILAVCRENLQDKLIAIPVGNKIEIARQVELPGGYVAGPLPIDERVLVALDTGDVVCYDLQLEQMWTARLPADKLVGDPQLRNGEIVLAFESGAVWKIDPQSGAISSREHIGQPIAFPPTQLGDRVFVSGADGTLHELAF